MTEAERIAVKHIVANAKEWRWTTAEILECGRYHATIDPHQLSRLPQLLQEEIDKHKATRKPATN